MLPIKSGPVKMNLDPILANVLVLEEDALDAKEANNTAKVITVMTHAVSLVVRVATTPVAVAVKAVEVVVKTVDAVITVKVTVDAVVTALSLDMEVMIGLTAMATQRVPIIAQASSCIQKAVLTAALPMAALTVVRTKMPMSMTKAQRLMPTITMAPLVAMLDVAQLMSTGLMPT